MSTPSRPTYILVFLSPKQVASPSGEPCSIIARIVVEQEAVFPESELSVTKSATKKGFLLPRDPSDETTSCSIFAVVSDAAGPGAVEREQARVASRRPKGAVSPHKLITTESATDRREL